MGSIFISYRRDDSEGHAGRLFEALVEVFGPESVFMDVAGLEKGRDFRAGINDTVASCSVLLAVIGRTWIDARNAAGERRLEDPADFVRLETAAALQRDIPVIPVLVHGAKMPNAEQMPADLAALAFRDGVELTHARWDSDVELLVEAIRPHVPRAHAAPLPSSAAVDASRTWRAPTPVTPVPAVPVDRSPRAGRSSRGILVGAVISAVAIVGIGVGVALSGGDEPSQDVSTEVASLTDSPAFETDATVVERVAVGDVGGGNVIGYFERNDDGTWTETDLTGFTKFTFDEVDREGTSIHLIDSSREAQVELDLDGRVVLYTGEGDATPRVIYDIAGAK